MFESALGNSFTVASRVKPEGLLAQLFDMLNPRSWIMQKVNKEGSGIQWNLSEMIEDLDFIDYILVVS